ncbi:MAG: hypothetical protein ABR915_19505 [Thermoguttaceae bacterium]|jgi:hypothetical protein
MATCASCGTTILFGGKRSGDLRFCSQKCFDKSLVVQLAAQLPEDLVNQEVIATHQGRCPKCQLPGPVDVHVSHRVWSALHVTRWSSRSQVSCRSCGVKSKLADAMFCFFLGWWGFPWGFIMTPIQFFRNLLSLWSTPDPTRPSPALESLVRAKLAAQVIAEHQAAKVSCADGDGPA